MRPFAPALSSAVLAAALATGLAAQQPAAQEPPTWEQLDAHAVPAWFADAKFGIFIHWGVYAVPSYCDTSTYSEWYQHWIDTNAHDGLERKFHERVYGVDFAYRDFAPHFQAELWDPAQWADVFARAGAKYIVITSKHHDGFCLWPNAKTSEVRGYPWSAMATGPKRDLLGELATAVRARGVKFGLYYSLMEWHNPIFERSIPDYVQQQMFPQVQELIERYQPAVFWPDGEWEHPDTTWRSRELLHWIRTHAKNADELVVNDRWGKGARGEHGDYYTTEYGGYGGSKTFLGQKPFEECRGIGHSFAFNRAENHDIYLSRTECVRTLIDLVSRGGNLLLDIGPAADGTIPVIMQDRLLAMGRWLERNGEAIYGCQKSPFRRSPWGRTTQKGEVVYLHVYDWPQGDRLAVPGLASNVQQAWLLGDAAKAPLPLARAANGVLTVDLRGRHPEEHATVIALRLDGALRVDDRFVADERGIVELPANAAVVAGKDLRVEPQGNLGYWSNTEATATWSKVSVVPGVEYTIEFDYALAPGEAGGMLELKVAGGPLSCTFPATKGWQDYGTHRPFSFTSNGAKEVEVVARASKLGKTALVNLRTIRFVPKLAPPAATPTDDRAAIERECARLCERLHARDGKAVAAAYLDDAILRGSGEPAITGRAAIDSYWQRIAAADAVAWQLETHDVRGGGDTLVQLGRSTLTTENAGRTNVSVVDFTLTWRRMQDGSLRIAADTWWPAK